MSDLKKIKDELLLKLKGKLNLSEVNQMKSDLFGKNGLVSSQFKKIGTIAETDRKKLVLLSAKNFCANNFLDDLIFSKKKEPLRENADTTKKMFYVFFFSILSGRKFLYITNFHTWQLYFSSGKTAIFVHNFLLTPQ